MGFFDKLTGATIDVQQPQAFNPDGAPHYRCPAFLPSIIARIASWRGGTISEIRRPPQEIFPSNREK